MSRQDENSGCGEIFAKAFANIIAALIIAGIWWCWEFVVNPEGNYTIVQDKGQVLVFHGPRCNDAEGATYNIEIVETSYAYKNSSKVTIAYWMKGEENKQTKTIKAKGSLDLRLCRDREEHVGYAFYVTYMAESQVTWRFQRRFEAYIKEK